MKAVLLFVTLSALSVATAAPYLEAEYQYMFTKWMTQNEKHYEIEDFFHRYSIFKDNLNFIDEHNAQNHSYTVGLNEFADLTTEEFGKRNTLQRSTASLHSSALPHESNQNVGIPTSVDWRNSKAVPVVKNQGSCGSCYAFSSVSTMETGWALKHGTLYGLSEQQLVDCSQKNGNHGCTGGTPEASYTFVVNSGGIANQVTYPYTGAVGTCKNVALSPVKITGYRSIGPNNENAILQAVAVQSVLVEIEADQQSFQFYSGGVFDNTACGTNLDHGVVIIGYGAAAGKNYWTVRNSWGPTWGESGYIRIVRGKNMCGINQAPYYPVMA